MSNKLVKLGNIVKLGLNANTTWMISREEFTGDNGEQAFNARRFVKTRGEYSSVNTYFEFDTTVTLAE